MPRRFPIFQFPNPPLIAAMLAGAIASTTEGRLSRNAKLLSRLALLVWSAGEITTGANLFRRLLGVIGGIYGLTALGRRAAAIGV
jgi:hypothetical protein